MIHIWVYRSLSCNYSHLIRVGINITDIETIIDKRNKRSWKRNNRVRGRRNEEGEKSDKRFKKKRNMEIVARVKENDQKIAMLIVGY